MSRIRILSDHVANQIAAGEVIERPVAVVKELLENSLDSGAKRIEIEFRNGGKSYIRIEDDGCGMTPDDALLCLERHATSKIQEAADLMKIRSFGFRGEAIPSIASISRFTLRTRAKESDHGCEVLVNAGKLIHRRDYGMNRGTQIEVANLFNSVPVRRKFMKTENTEAAHIVHLVRLYAIGHPEISFTLIENGRLIFKSLISKKLIDRVLVVWNLKLEKELIEIEVQDGAMRLYGLIGKPGIARATRQEMVTFVNGRPVDSKTLNYAVMESYHTYIPKGRFPIVFLFLEIDPEFVDVNVHPAKREVRFRNDALVRQFVISILLDCLRPLNDQVDQKEIELKKVLVPILQQPPSIPVILNAESKVSIASTPVGSTAMKSYGLESIGNAVKCETAILEMPLIQQVEEVIETTSLISPLSWRLVGELLGKYFLFEAPEGLIILNTKRAWQRVLYETIKKSFTLGEPCLSQPLLFPIPIAFDPLTSIAFEGCFEYLNKGGFKIEVFGRNFYRLEAVPSWLDTGLAEIFIRDVAALVREQGSIPRSEDLLHEKIANLAVTQTLRFDGQFSDEKIQHLLRDLLACDNPLTCPRGNPTYFELSSRDLEKRFGGFF